MTNVHFLWRKHKYLGTNIDMSSDSDANFASQEVPNYCQHSQPARVSHYSNNTAVLSAVLAANSCQLFVLSQGTSIVHAVRIGCDDKMAKVGESCNLVYSAVTILREV
jgi:hypothetical protein